MNGIRRITGRRSFISKRDVILSKNKTQLKCKAKEATPQTTLFRSPIVESTQMNSCTDENWEKSAKVAVYQNNLHSRGGLEKWQGKSTHQENGSHV
jgi:hypothetical protein